MIADRLSDRAMRCGLALRAAALVLVLFVFAAPAAAADRYGKDEYRPVVPPSYGVLPTTRIYKAAPRRRAVRRRAVFSYEVDLGRKGGPARYFALLSEEAG